MTDERDGGMGGSSVAAGEHVSCAQCLDIVEWEG